MQVAVWAALVPYLFGRTRCPKAFLDSTEAQGDHGFDQLTLAENVWVDGIALDRDVHVLPHQLWALLNVNLTGNQKKTHQAISVDLTHGGRRLEVWRKVVRPLVRKSEEAPRALRCRDPFQGSSEVFRGDGRR